MLLDQTIAIFLIQDGVTNGAVYALLGLAIVLVFSVTRVIFIPQGEFVAHGALTLAMLDAGRVPGTPKLLICFGAIAFLLDLWATRREFQFPRFLRSVAVNLLLGHRNRVGMSTRTTHDPTPESNAQLVAFFTHFLQP